MNQTNRSPPEKRSERERKMKNCLDSMIYRGREREWVRGSGRMVNDYSVSTEVNTHKASNCTQNSLWVCVKYFFSTKPLSVWLAGNIQLCTFGFKLSAAIHSKWFSPSNQVVLDCNHWSWHTRKSKFKSIDGNLLVMILLCITIPNILVRTL